MVRGAARSVGARCSPALPGSITLMWSTDRLHCALHCHAFLL